MILWGASNTLFNIWLSIWTASTVNPDRVHDNNYFITYYIIFGIFYGVFAFLRALLQAFSNPLMSTRVHESMNTNLLFSPLN
jgi:hypothetical protein